MGQMIGTLKELLSVISKNGKLISSYIQFIGGPKPQIKR